MPRYDQNGTSFDTPEDWVDRSIVAFVAPSAPGAENATNIVVTQEKLRDGSTLRTQADQHLMELAKQLKDFDILESRDTQLGGLPAIFMRFAWKNQFGILEQTMTLVEKPTPSGPVVLTFTTTTRADEADKNRPIIREILRSVRFAPAGTPSVAPAVPSAPPAPGPNEGFIPMPGYRRERR